MDQEHVESLMALWDSETEDPATQEWRDSLTPEEARLVESWDRSWDSGVLKLSEDILTADQRLTMKDQIDGIREEELRWRWSNESADSKTREWRKELTPKEADLVESWDIGMRGKPGEPLDPEDMEEDTTDLWKEPVGIVGVAQKGVPVGLFGRRAPGFVLENGTVLLESEKDINGFYIGGSGMDGMYLRTPERYEPVRDDAGQLTGFRSMSKHVAAFSGEELGLIYSYALSPEEDLVKDLNAVRQRLGKVPEAQALYTSTIEKLEQIPPDERRRLVADVYAAWKERHMEDLRGRQQAARSAGREAER